MECVKERFCVADARGSILDEPDIVYADYKVAVRLLDMTANNTSPVRLRVCS